MTLLLFSWITLYSITNCNLLVQHYSALIVKSAVCVLDPYDILSLQLMNFFVLLGVASFTDI